MQNTLISTPVLSSANEAIAMAAQVAGTVLKSDTAATPNAKSKGSIKLSALRVPLTVTVGKTTTTVAPQITLAGLEQASKSWETTELAASNKRLYSILKDAYSYYLEMKQDTSKATRKARVDELEAFIKQRGYVFMPSSHDMTRVVKCVFGMDRRRVSAYSIALRAALQKGIAASDLAEFIAAEGGVEQIRMGGTKPLSVTKRAEKAADEVLGAELGLFKFDPKLFAADADWADKQVVIVATYLPTGEFQTNAVIRHDSAVNAALAAYYSQQQAKVREIAKAEREAEEQRVADSKKTASNVKSGMAKNAPQPSKEQKQKAKAAKETATKNQQAANKAHLNSLLLEPLA